jgi:hypothetical protein
MNYCKCLKCKKVFNIDNMNALEVEELNKKGCSSCHGKKFEWKVYIGEIDIELNWTSDECSKCHLPKVMDILNWEEVKGKFIKKGIKTKEEAIKQMNKNDDNTCYCANLEDKDQERERETKKLRNYGERLPN